MKLQELLRAQLLRIIEQLLRIVCAGAEIIVCCRGAARACAALCCCSMPLWLITI